MRNLVIVFIFWLASAAMAVAQCTGQDLRATLTPAERADVKSRLVNTPYPVGNHWTARKGGQTIHLVGTVHMSDPRLDAVMKRLRPVLKQADLLLVEATRADKKKLETAMLETPERILLPDGASLPELLSDAEWKTIKKAARSRGVPPFLVSKFQPWYVSVVLAMPACLIEVQRSGAKGFDVRLMDAADELSIPQAALEPWDTMFSLFERDPIEKQLEMLKLGVLPNDVAQDSMATLLDAYFEERPAEIIEFNRVLAHRHTNLPKDQVDAMVDSMNDLLLRDRNLNWIPVIENAPNGVTVVAAGAGHLVGTHGLLNLLRQNGYKLTREAF